MTNEIKAIETHYDGRRFRSRVEARWAVFFNHLGLDYDYEREGFDLDGEWYLPDFYLPAFLMWIEVKGVAPTPREQSLCRSLRDKTGQRVLIAVGPPQPHAHQIIAFEPDGSERSDCVFLADRRNEGQYWLGTGSDAYLMDWWTLGPDVGPPHDREPIVNLRLDAAYREATVERFDRTGTGADRMTDDLGNGLEARRRDG